MDQKWGCYQHQQVSFKTFIMYREEGEMLLSNGLLTCWFQQIHSILHFSTYCHRKFSAAWFTQNLNWKKGQHFFLQAELLFFYFKALEVISFLSLEITCRRGWEYILDFAVTVTLVYSWDLGKCNALAVLPCGLHIQSPFLGKGTRSRLFREGGGNKSSQIFVPSSFHKTEDKNTAVQTKIPQTMRSWSYWKSELLGSFKFSPLSYCVTLNMAWQLEF